MKELMLILEKLSEFLKSEESIALATVVHVEGSAYRRPGARMLIDSKGNWWGGISGGCLEGDLLKKATLAMHQQTIKRITYDTREDDPFQLGVGLGCQGLIEILIDPIRENIEQTFKILKQAVESSEAQFICTKWSDNGFHCGLQEKAEIGWNEQDQIFTEYLSARTRIWVIGNQFDACSLIELCLNLAWDVHWVGNTPKMRKELQKRVTAYYDWESVEGMCSSDYVVMMTHDFDRDVAFMNKYLIENIVQYLGILGPTKRFDRLQKQINGKLVTDIASPVGLDIGAEGADEIAVAIVAEILAVQRNRNGQRLKFRESTIH